jgi:hypothetical protein
MIPLVDGAHNKAVHRTAWQAPVTFDIGLLVEWY